MMDNSQQQINEEVDLEKSHADKIANFQLQINKTVDSEESHTQKIEKITELGVWQIIELLGIERSECIVSIRERSGYKNSHMRLYYSSDKFKKIMSDSTKKTEVTKEYFKNDKNNRFPKENDEQDKANIVENENPYYSNIYSLVNCSVSDASNKNKESFKSRIDGFLAKCITEDPNHEEDLKRLKTCIVIGKDFSNARYQQSNSDKNSKWVDQIVVIYSILDRQSIKNKYSDIVNIIEIIFRSLDTIRTYELLDFERKALNQMSTLAPAISNGSMSASEAITKVTTALKKLLNNHLESISEKGDLEVFFIQICEKKLGDKTMPIFRIIPEITIDSGKAFEFSHESTKTISKYLLYREIKDRDKKKKPSYSLDNLAPCYNEMFEKIDDDSLELSKSDEPDIYSMLVTNSDNTEIWQFNKNLSEESDTNTGSMAAYLFISNKDSNNVIPSNSIIIFQSRNAYVFSDELVSLLSHIVSLVSSIFKTIRMGDLTTDYVSAIREAYRINKNNTICKNAKDYGEGSLKFDLSRISWFDLKNYFKTYSEKFYLPKTPGEDQKAINGFINLLRDGIKDFENESPEKIHSQKLEFLNLNKDNIIDEFKKSSDEKLLTEEQKEIFIDFIQLCPSDVTWHCWVGAIRAVLESRNLYHKDEINSSGLIFKIAIPGYSALELLMVSASNEISQVIKLGHEEKLRTEKNQYQKYVRYQILYAARIPQDGFAYECNGSGDEGFKYGALVSDLVTGLDKTVSTLLNHTSPPSKLNKNTTPIDHISPEILKTAIEHLFNVNLTPWYSPKNQAMEDGDLENFTGDDLIEYTSRCTGNIANIKNWNDLLDKDTTNINSESIKCLNATVESFSDIFCKTKKNAPTFFKKIQLNSSRKLTEMEDVFDYSVIHGDLNSRNLIWSDVHKNFFIIDFENIKSGFYGADQIFLFVSMICEIEPISNFQELNQEYPEKTIFATYINSVVRNIFAVFKFLDTFKIIASTPEKDRSKKAANCWEIADRKNPKPFYDSKAKNDDKQTCALNDIARRHELYNSLFLSTIKPLNEKIMNQGGDEIVSFWLSAYKGFAVKQLTYALQNLNTVSKRNGHEGDFKALLKPAREVVVQHLHKINGKPYTAISTEKYLELEPAALSVAFALLLTMATFE